MTTATRPVRVTIEGEAYSPAVGVLIVKRADGGKTVVSTDSVGVTVEDIAPAWVWTDGDVVQVVDTDRVYRRVSTEDGGHRWSNGFLAFLTDGIVSVRVAAGELRVLRYQSGGDA